MSTPNELPLEQRPIRELVCPEFERPIDTPAPGVERRRDHRYARRLPGVLTVRGVPYRVKCVEVGFGGMRVSAPATVQVADGDRAVVGIKLGARLYQDEFSVVAAERSDEATVVHLDLQFETAPTDSLSV